MRVHELQCALRNKFLVALVVLWSLPLMATELPEGPGKNLVLAQCGVCHSLALVTQNRMTRDKWDETITWMQETQNLWLIPPEMRNSILDYLEKHFSPQQDAPSLLRPRVNPLPAG
jgi:hypothetical protein